MADKIANFEDYKNREAAGAGKSGEPAEKPGKPVTGAEEHLKDSADEMAKQNKRAEVERPRATEPPKTPVPQETMNIEIEDPFQFLNAEEREEYILQRQKELMAAEHRQEDKPAHREEERPERPRPQRREDPPRDAEYEDEDYDPEFEEEYNDEYEGTDGDEGYEDGDEPDDKNILLIVRIGSIITGLIILFFIGMVVKTKVIDRYLAPDPDEAPAAVAVVPAVPAGFTEKNDTVVVTGASSLNLRSGPDTGSTVMGQAAEGEELKRIAVADDGKWALVEYQGQQVYASMKYLKEK